MQPVPQDLLKKYVQSQHFSSAADIRQAMKEMFRDVIQQVMEVEMDEELGRERCQRSEEPKGMPRNYRNGYSQKSIKTQLGKIDVKIPRDRNGAFEPKILVCSFRFLDYSKERLIPPFSGERPPSNT